MTDEDCGDRCCKSLGVMVLMCVTVGISVYLSVLTVKEQFESKIDLFRDTVNSVGHVEDIANDFRRRVESIEQNNNRKLRDTENKIAVLVNAQRDELTKLQQEIENTKKNLPQLAGQPAVDIYGKTLESTNEKLTLLDHKVSQNFTILRSMLFHIYGRAQIASNQCRKDNWRISARQRIMEREIQTRFKELGSDTPKQVEIPVALKTRSDQLDENIAMKPSSKDIEMLQARLQEMDEAFKMKLKQIDDRVDEYWLICVGVLLVIAIAVVVVGGVYYTKHQFSLCQRTKYHQV